ARSAKRSAATAEHAARLDTHFERRQLFFLPLKIDPKARFGTAAIYASWPWQCLYFLPEPQGQGSLRPTLPQVAGLFASRSAEAGVTSGIGGWASSSSPVSGFA